MKKIGDNLLKEKREYERRGKTSHGSTRRNMGVDGKKKEKTGTT